MSVHKSQGSEYPAVVVVLLPQQWVMLQRNLLYTAVTRARRLVGLVGAERAIRTALDAGRRTLGEEEAPARVEPAGLL